MKPEDLHLLSQLVDSSELVVREFESAIEKKDDERMKRAREEILHFQEQIGDIIRK
ncbi:MAG: hypothetical protein AABX71_02710 [Nanoarchaeota archaeon]